VEPQRQRPRPEQQRVRARRAGRRGLVWAVVGGAGVGV
jgi:hypothetical protein